MSIQGLQITNEQIRYVFPKEIRNITEFVRLKEIKNKLKQEFKVFGNILPNFPYRSCYTSRGVVIFFQCIFCSNRLVYEVNREKGKYELKTFSIDHVHGRNFDHQEIKRNEAIEQFSILNCNVPQIIKERTERLREPLANHVSNKKKKKLKQPNSFDELIKTLKDENYFVSYEPENFKEQELTYPDYLLIISQEMKKIYHKNARCVGLDFTYSLIREAPLTKYSSREYMIGVIAGLNSYRRIAIYALIVATEECAHYVEKAFTEFIKYMEKQPESIVTDQSVGILAGLKRIKENGVFKGNTFWDTFHVLRNYRFRNRELKSHIRKMVRVKCKYEFHKMYLEAVTMARTEDQMDAIHKFMHEAQKYSISQIPPDFIGLGVSDSQNEMVNNLIKSELPHESKYIKVVHRILTFIEQRNLLTQMMTRESSRVDEIVNSRELNIVRYSLCRKVYSFFFLQVYRCSKVDLVYQDNEDNIFYCVQDFNTVHFVVKLPIQQLKHLCVSRTAHIKEGFQCSCQFQEKTGIPCEHILKVVFETDRNFIDRIDQYWVVENPEKLFKCISNYGCQTEPMVKKRGRPQGKPTLFYNPQESAQLKLPQCISTYEPIKPRNHNQPFSKNVQQIDIYESEEDIEQLMKMEQEEKLGKTRRTQMIKDFYSGRGA